MNQRGFIRMYTHIHMCVCMLTRMHTHYTHLFSQVDYNTKTLGSAFSILHNVYMIRDFISQPFYDSM